MKLFYKFSFIFLFVSISYANNINSSTIVLDKHFKVENTFSGNLSKTASFHLIFSKNRKNKMYTVHSYIFNGDEITTLNTIENKKPYSLVSFHTENNTLSLLLSYKIKKDAFLKRVAINTINKKITEKEAISHKDFFTSIREKNKSILLYKNKEKFEVLQFKGTEETKTISYNFQGKNDTFKLFLEDNPIDAVKTDEFVANGSTADLRVYLDNSTLVFTKENKKSNYTELTKIALNTNELIPSDIKKFSNTRSDKTYKKFTSFYHNNTIYQFANDKKAGNIKIHNLTTNKSSSIAIDASLISKIKGNTNFAGFENFLKQAGKNKYKTTVTVNPTKENKLKVRVDYVDVNYSYHYNWWWHHHQFFMWQQQMMMHNIKVNTPSGFGPSQPNDFHFNTYIIKKEKRYFELLLNNENELLNEDVPKSVYKEIDKEKYIDKLEDNSDLKHKSSCFLENSYRYIGYSRKLKSFIFQTNKL